MKKILLGFILLAISFPINLGIAFDKQLPKTMQLEHAAYVKIIINGQIKGKWEGKNQIKKFYHIGSGFIAQEGYVITSAHILDSERLNSTSEEPTFLEERKIRIKNQADFFVKAKVHFVDQKKDIAVLTYQNQKYFKKMIHLIGNPQEIELGDVVCAVFHSRDKDWMLTKVFLKTGKIKKLQPYKNLNLRLELEASPGDSGSPVFAFKNGKPVLIGIMQGISITYPKDSFANILFKIIRCSKQ